MTILSGIYKSKGGRGVLTKQNASTCLFCQGAGKGVPVGEPTEAFLQQLDKIIDVEGLAFFSQYLNGQIDQRLTSSPTPGCKGRLCFGLPSQLPDSTQLIFKL
jgi:hypothetical protein